MEKGREYYVETFGCRVNQADTAGLVLELEKGTLRRTEKRETADVVVLNTCTVTHRADVDVRKAVHRIKRENPAAKVIVAGCYAQRDPDAVRDISGVNAVVGNSHKSMLPILSNQLAHDTPTTPSVFHTPMEQLQRDELPPVTPTTSVVDRTRPFVKIQDGCDAVCTYCIIPSVRGPARSAPVREVLTSVTKLVTQGFKEIVLTGVHLGTYGEALAPEETLTSLVRQALEVPGLCRLRMSCIEPMAFPLGLVDLAQKDTRLVPHFHLPLQSGCDRILKRMVRPYRARDYQDILDSIREKLPRVCLGTDVIVGFPGETDAEFETTLRFIEESGLNYVHVFSYSDREGVASTRLDGKVDPRVIKERSVRLHAVGKRLWEDYLDSRVGQTREVVTLERDQNDRTLIKALTDDYCPISISDPDLEPNQICRVSLRKRIGQRILAEQAL